MSTVTHANRLWHAAMTAAVTRVERYTLALTEFSSSRQQGHHTVYTQKTVRGPHRVLDCTAQIQRAQTFEAFNAVQFSEQLVHNTICDACRVMAPTGRYGVKLIKEQHAWRSSAGSPAHAS